MLNVTVYVPECKAKLFELRLSLSMPNLSIPVKRYTAMKYREILGKPKEYIYQFPLKPQEIVPSNIHSLRTIIGRRFEKSFLPLSSDPTLISAIAEIFEGKKFRKLYIEIDTSNTSIDAA